METTLLLEYGWVLLVLIFLEGLLAADNALVLAIMVKHLPEEQRKKALFYGLAGAFIFRFSALFLISFLVDVWQVQAIGALYLLFLSGNHLVKKYIKKEQHHEDVQGKNSGFWFTVFKVEVADIAFAIDSILAAVALAVTLTPLNMGKIGGLDAGQFIIILTGGLIGVIIMRFAANVFVQLLKRKPGLETAAFLIVGWVGVKLGILTLSHPAINVLDPHFAHSTLWKVIFWIVLLSIAILGYIFSKEESVKNVQSDTIAH